jgi:hypothetical protein
VRAKLEIVILRVVLASLLIIVALGSCGKVGNEGRLQLDSNTNWLMRCDGDDQCDGSLRCFCGQCSQPCSTSDECGLLAGAECASSGGAACTGEPSAGGLCVLGCTGDAECGPDFTCTEGQCLPRPCSGGFQSWDEVLQLVARDLAGRDSDDALFTRYVSLANRWAYGACGRALVAERQGLSKLLNSLSRSSTIVRPAPVDADQMLYRIDLRDYEWHEPVTVQGTEYADAWEALISHNAFAVSFVGDDADDATTTAGTLVPVMFANSLIATALRSDVYYAIAGVPERLDELFTQLGIGPSPASEAPTLRAGYSYPPDVIASYWATGSRPGYLWDIGAVVGVEGVFANPLAAALGDHQIVFSLANGLQGFALMNEAGLTIEDSDTFLDTSQTNFRMQAPRSLLAQHSPRLNVYDQVAETVALNAGSYDAATRAAILTAYPGASAVEALLLQDYETLTRPALEQAGVNLAFDEPISQAYSEYARDMTIEDMAGELLVSREELENNLGLLDPSLGFLSNGLVARDDFAILYKQSLCILAVVNDNPPSPDVCP